MSTTKGLPWLVISQLLVTLSLLAFAFNQTSDVKDLVVGAVIAHWLNETANLGRQLTGTTIADNLTSAMNNALTTGADAVTSAATTSAPVSQPAPVAQSAPVVAASPPQPAPGA